VYVPGGEGGKGTRKRLIILLRCPSSWHPPLMIPPDQSTILARSQDPCHCSESVCREHGQESSASVSL
jgi:hypothetical protein